MFVIAVLSIVLSSRALYRNAGLETSLSIPYLQEAYYAFLLLYSCVRLFIVRDRQDTLLNLLALLFVLSTISLSALFANLTFGQPFIYGLAEERRMIGLLSLFFIYDATKAYVVKDQDLSKVLAASILVVLIVSVLSMVELQNVMIGGRQGRFRTVGYFFAITYIYFLSVVIDSRRYSYTWTLLASALAILLISQTRLITANIALVTAAFLLLSSRKVFVVLLAITSTFSYIIVLTYGQQLESLFEVDTASAVVRQYSLAFFWDLLERNNYMAGIGALSLQWQDGFHDLASGQFREHVFLSDLGLFGEFVRYGAVYPFVLALLGTIVFSCRPRRTRSGSKYFYVTLAFILASSPLLGTFAMQGELLGMFLAISRVIGWMARRTHAQDVVIRNSLTSTSRTTREPANHSA